MTCSDAVLQSLAAVSQNLVQSDVISADRKQVSEKLLQLCGVMEVNHQRLPVIGFPDVVEQDGDHFPQESVRLTLANGQPSL